MARQAAYVAVCPGDPETFIVALVVEGDDGYRPVTEYEDGPREKIEGLVARLNARMGVTHREATKLAISTMKTVSAPFSAEEASAAMAPSKFGIGPGGRGKPKKRAG